MGQYPKIQSVRPLASKKLEVTFDRGIKKIYDCTKLLNQEAFISLNNDAVFNCVHVECGGYGIAWDDDTDLSESELWINGKEIKKKLWPPLKTPS
ncbi:MAG: DUF2442 domain-containing protein [Deltaproteobacteria bacterium]|nr:DUF2442 domain-containing protein [Deltaproteobacteria bacterium]